MVADFIEDRRPAVRRFVYRRYCPPAAGFSLWRRALLSSGGQSARQQEKIAARDIEEKATGKRKRGRKPKEPDPSVEPDRVANPTDPDSGIMKTRRGWVQGYNAQAVVTPDQIILAADVTTEANDVRQLTGMLNQAQANVAAVMGEDATLGAAVASTGSGRDLVQRPFFSGVTGLICGSRRKVFRD